MADVEQIFFRVKERMLHQNFLKFSMVTRRRDGKEGGRVLHDTYSTQCCPLQLTSLEGYDVLKMASTEDEAIKLAKDDKPVFENGGFHLNNSVRNTDNISNSIPREHRFVCYAKGSRETK